MKAEVATLKAENAALRRDCLNRAAFPPEAAAPVQYGPRVKSAAVYLRDQPIAPGGKEPVDTFIRDLAAKAEVASFDETGVRATGSLHWLHTVSTRWLTWYFAHKRRGRKAMNAANILPDFRGRAVHDFF